MLKILIKRIKGKTPKFFRNLQKIGLMIGAIGTAFAASNIEKLNDWSSLLITIGSVIAAVCQFTVEDVKELEN